MTPTENSTGKAEPIDWDKREPFGADKAFELLQAAIASYQSAGMGPMAAVYAAWDLYEFGLRRGSQSNADGEHPDCPSCICGKRAPVQASRYEVGANGYEDKGRPRMGPGAGPGTISWAEHLIAWGGYDAKWGSGQTAERLAERGGFSYAELLDFIGHEPKTWMPRR